MIPKASPTTRAFVANLLSRRVMGATTNNLTQCQKARLSTETFYDSQSGLHLPKHNEKTISVFLNVSNESTSPDSFIPAQFYKEDSSSDVPEKLSHLVKQGIVGLCLPPSQFPRDIRNLTALDNIAPSGFRFFSSISASLPQPLKSLSSLHDFHLDESQNHAIYAMKEQIDNGLGTTLRIGDAVWGNADSMSIASQLGTIIDETGGANYIWVTPHSSADEDDVVELCEELMYLDVAGPTIQSRIIIDSTKEEVIDETMLIGINKFVVKETDQVDLVEEIAKEQGKGLLTKK